MRTMNPAACQVRTARYRDGDRLDVTSMRPSKLDEGAEIISIDRHFHDVDPDLLP